MKIVEKKILFVFLNFLLSAITIIALNANSRFITVSRIGLIAIMVMLFIDFVYVGKVVYPFFLIMLCFVLFQFGTPILYAVDRNYTNWYIGQFYEEDLVYCAKFSIYCILAFNFGGGLSYYKPTTVAKHRFSKLFDDEKMVTSTAKTLALLTGLIVIPLTFYITAMSMRYGYNYVKDDEMGIYNGLTNAVRAFFVPALLLWLTFEKNKRTKRKLVFTMLLYALLSMSSGGRTEGLPLLLTLLYYYQQNTEDQAKGRSFARNFLFVGGGLVILYLVVFAAQSRTNTRGNSDLFSVFESLFGELGFNFTSVCFTREFVPSTEGFRNGMSYLNSLLCLFPKSLDPTGTIAAIDQSLPSNWLTTQLTAKYGSLYHFGVGYSVIAECYLNFGDYGWISSLIQGMLVQKLMGFDHRKYSSFERYVQLVLLWALVTYPRRSISTLLKTLEYCIVAIIVLMWIARSIKKGRNIQTLNL